MKQKSDSRSQKAATLDQPFWRKFSANIWEKKALTVKNLQSGLTEMGEDTIFKLLVSYADRCRKLDDPTGFKFYIDGQKAYGEDVLQVLPVKKDKSLLGYHARMNEMFSDYCLVCDELLTANIEKQSLLTEFTNELYRHVGFPNRFSEMGLYLGNYRKTPFGVHVDRCGVFSFPVTGVKRFRLWTSEFVKKNPSLDRAFEYGKFKKASQLIEARPGDMTYWPSSAWHIAESDGSFSATWSLGVWVDKPFKDTFTEALKTLLDQKLSSLGDAAMTEFKDLHEATGEMKKLPTAYAESIQLLQNLSAAELKESMLQSWMIHTSLRGFKTLPQVDCELSLKSRLQLRSAQSPILWQQSLADKKKFFFSFGGKVIQTSTASDFVKLVKALNAGESCLVSDYIKGTRKTQGLRDLQVLADAGAFK